MENISERSLRRLEKLLFRAASYGEPTTVAKMKKMLDASGCAKKLASKINAEDTDLTPLILASQNGHIDVVKYLIEKCKVDVNQRLRIFYGEHQAGNILEIVTGTALHAAVVSGNVKVVDFLSKQGKADINSLACVSTGSMHYDVNYAWYLRNESLTPLQLAVSFLCGRVQEEIVCCLLHHGADRTIHKKLGEDCWEHTSNVETTKLLIYNGIGLKSTNRSLINVLHKWARSTDDRACEVIDYAIANGADLNQMDCNGLTPMLLAATGEDSNSDVLQLICTQSYQPVSRLDKIAGFELMGATCIQKGEKEKGLHFWETAMNLRFNIAHGPPIPKIPIAMNGSFRTAFQGISEVQHLEEMENIRLLEHNELIKQAHLVYIRTLGMNNIETIRMLYAYASSKWNMEKQSFLNYSTFIIENCDSTEVDVWSVRKNLIFLSIATLFTFNDSEIPRGKLTTFANYAMPILRKLVSFLQQISDDNDNKKHKKFILDAIVHLTYIMANFVILSPEEVAEFECCLNQAIHLEKRTWEYICISNCPRDTLPQFEHATHVRSYDLLLLACTASRFCGEFSNGQNSVKNFNLTRPVSDKVISLLLKLGANPKSAAFAGDTGLHILARNHQTLASPSVKALLEAGADMLTTNRRGETMLDIMSSLPPFPSLQSLCARTIRSYNFDPLIANTPYSKLLPTEIGEPFKAPQYGWN